MIEEFGVVELIMLILSLFITSTGGGDAPIEGDVHRVIDGDTVEITNNGTVYDVRLIGMNAPETSTQYMNGFEVENLSENCRLAYGDLAERKLREKVENQSVQLRYDTESGTQDQYDRYLAEIIVDGLNVNVWMVEQGYAVGTTEKYDYMPANDQKYSSAEQVAESNNRGVWKGCSEEVPN